jgi:F-type H+-transporting ATPase subunit b
VNEMMILAAKSACGAENCAHFPPWVEVIWGTIAFVLVVGLIAWKGGPAIKKAWNGRIERIEGELASATEARTAAEADLDGVRQSIANADSERQRILDEAHTTAANLKAQLVERAQAEAAEIKARALADIEASQAQARADLSAEVSTLAVGAAERVVASSLDDDTQRKLIEDYIAKVGASS